MDKLKNRVSISDIVKWSEQNQVFIDVRSEGEFKQGHLPNALNAPILNDEERALIGLTYKQKGNAEAVRLGYEVVSGENKKAKMKIWKDILQKYPQAILTCFRGGQRSQITQAWLKEEGFDRPLIEGGYKVARQSLIDKIDDFQQQYQFILLSGPTGAGKTELLEEITKIWPTLFLEKYAEHRGSAFGGFGKEQPSQAVFENRLAWDLLKKEKIVKSENLAPIMEDESRLIGRNTLPEMFFEKLRSSSVLWLDVTLEQRVENTFQEYIVKAPASEELFNRYKVSLKKIEKRLGGLQYREILELLEKSESAWKSRGDLEENKNWIERLLVKYYDPLYFGSLERRNPPILFKGKPQDVLDFLKGQKSKTSDRAVRIKAIPI